MADPMTREEVFELAQLFGQLPQDQAEELVATLQAEQPGLYDLLKGLARLFPNRDQRDQLRSVAVTTWLIMKRSANPPGLVTVEAVQRAHEAYQAELARLTTAKGEARHRAVAQAVLSHPEPALLAYMMLMVRKGIDPPLEDDAYIQAANLMRAVLDALIASRARKAGRPQRRRPAGRA